MICFGSFFHLSGQHSLHLNNKWHPFISIKLGIWNLLCTSLSLGTESQKSLLWVVVEVFRVLFLVKSNVNILKLQSPYIPYILMIFLNTYLSQKWMLSLCFGQIWVSPWKHSSNVFVFIALVRKILCCSFSYTTLISSQPRLARVTSFHIGPFQTSYLAAIYHFKAS